MEDNALLQEYARDKSESAFTALVERYIGLVYSAALRQVRDPHLAKDVTEGRIYEPGDLINKLRGCNKCLAGRDNGTRRQS